MRLALALLILPPLAACVTLQPLACTGAARPRLVAELIFGRNIGDRLGVSDAAWRRFLDEEVTPRFPNGFTVMDTRGQWGEGGRVVREPGKMLVVALDEEGRENASLEAIVSAYKRQFRQSSVVSIMRPACVGF
jgi:Protein of unknown function (DUF3574)